MARCMLWAVVLLLGLASMVVPNASAQATSQCETPGDSVHDRQGCLDSDGDGWSDPDAHLNASSGADAFPFNASEHRDLDGDGWGDAIDEDMDGDGANDNVDVWPEDPGIWSDWDGDGYADQGQHDLSDNCPNVHGTSRIRLLGCSDIDGDFIPDPYDDDADGDGIRNELERAASSGLVLYDPFNADSTPLDSDQDTIPDVLDDDNDNDGWPDDVEYDRGSDPFDADETPFTLYMGINSGIFYLGGLGPGSFGFEYNADHFEISLSGLSEIVFEELVIPLLLVPVYVGVYAARRREHRRCLGLIRQAESKVELAGLERIVNRLVRERKLRVYHGLVLRNAIEERESEMFLKHESE